VYEGTVCRRIDDDRRAKPYRGTASQELGLLFVFDFLAQKVTFLNKDFPLKTKKKLKMLGAAGELHI
jgi:hypothetical protein